MLLVAAVGTAAAPRLVAADLPYRSPDTHLGVASCASSLCHGSVQPNPKYNVALNEFVTWSHQDKHAKAYEALSGGQARAIAAKLGLASAENAKICLDCHADNVPAGQRGPRFALSDGVGCEACHGGAQRWIASHTTKSSYPADVAQGMYPSADLVPRAALCESCHVGNADKLATHRIMGAGHPRLSFELDTYLALEPPHYVIDASYRRRKPAFMHAQLWAQGQLEAAELQLTWVQRQGSEAGQVFPELALFNCAACHDSRIQHPEWRRRAMTELTMPGMVPLNDASWRMSWLIARALDPDAGAQLLAAGQALQKAAMGNREQLAAQARSLSELLQRWRQRQADTAWSTERTMAVLQSILQAGSEAEFRDYLGAEQAVMAAELLLIDLGQAVRLRPKVDELYRLVRSDESFHSAEFIAALQDLRAAL